MGGTVFEGVVFGKIGKVGVLHLSGLGESSIREGEGRKYAGEVFYSGLTDVHFWCREERISLWLGGNR